MSDKIQLQEHNIKLSTIHSTIDNLPLKTLVEAAARQGQYVWKKSEPGFDITGTRSGGTVTRAIYTLNTDSSFTKEDFIGASIYKTDGSIIGNFADDGSIIMGSNKVGYSYDDSTKTLGINNPISDTTITIKKENVFINYVVNDSESAYPDGGMQDGYWYERVVEGIDLLGIFGLTKMAIDTFTLSSATSTPQINHSLGETPKFAMIVAKFGDITTGTNLTQVAVYGSPTEYNLGGGARLSYHSSYPHLVSNTNYANWTNTTISPENLNNFNFVAGVEYTVITMA